MDPEKLRIFLAVAECRSFSQAAKRLYISHSTTSRAVAALEDLMHNDVVSRSRNVHSMQDVIDKIIDLRDEVNAEIDKLVDLRKEIVAVITAVENPEYQALLEMRYLCFKSWQDIAREMQCSESNVYKLHTRALKEIKNPEIG